MRSRTNASRPLRFGDQRIHALAHIRDLIGVNRVLCKPGGRAAKRRRSLIYLIHHGLPPQLGVGERNLRSRRHQRLTQLRELEGSDQGR